MTEFREYVIDFVAKHNLDKVYEYYTEEIYYDKVTKIFYKVEDEDDGFKFIEIDKDNLKYDWYCRRFLIACVIRKFLEVNMRKAISGDYVNEIVDNIIDDVIDDIKETADKDFNEDDIRLAVGRVLFDRLGIEH